MRISENRRRERKSSIMAPKKQPESNLLLEEPLELSPALRPQPKSERNGATRPTLQEGSPLTPSPKKDFSLLETQFQGMIGKMKSVREPCASSISERHRAAILDWIVEVMAVYKQSDLSLFRCARLIDAFYASSSKERRISEAVKEEEKSVVSSSDIHLTGSAAISLASKFDNARFIPLKTLQNQILQGRFSVEELVQREIELVSKSNFDMAKPTPPELLITSLSLLPLSENATEFIKNAGLMMLRMWMFSGEIMRGFSDAEMTGLALVLGVKLMEQMRPELKSGELMEAVVARFQLGGPLLFQKLQMLHQFTLQFEEMVPNARNLIKYHTFAKTL